MRFSLTITQTVCFFVTMWVASITFLGPYYGRPAFRYTCSDPTHFVWNLGFPFPVFIYDSANPPYLFHHPGAIVMDCSGVEESRCCI